MGHIVPPIDKHLFLNVKSGTKPKTGYGTQINDSKYSINKFFQNNNLKFVFEIKYITDIIKAKELLEYNKNNDIIVCFNVGYLYDKPNSS